MRNDPRFIHEYAASLFPAAARLQPVILTPKQRQMMGGRLFLEAPLLIGMLGAAMAERPELFAQFPFSGTDLLDQQERAQAWKDLKHHLLILLDIANDSYLHEQGGAIDKMQRVIDEIATRKDLRYTPDPHAAERDFLLGPFFRHWNRRQNRIRRRARKTKKKARLKQQHAREKAP